MSIKKRIIKSKKKHHILVVHRTGRHGFQIIFAMLKWLLSIPGKSPANNSLRPLFSNERKFGVCCRNRGRLMAVKATLFYSAGKKIIKSPSPGYFTHMA